MVTSLIIGGTRGIGLVVSKHLVNRGDKVYTASRRTLEENNHISCDITKDCSCLKLKVKKLDNLIFTHRYRGDDYVEGTLASTHVEFSEVHAEYKTQTTNSKGRTQTHWHTIFKGLLFSVDFNKDFNVKTYVLTDTAEKIFGFLGTKLQSMNKSRGELVKLENPEFEESFVAYSSNQIEARYILSSSFMERILAFKKHTKKYIQLSFISSRMYIAVPYHKNLFEPKLFGDIVNFDHIKDYHNDLSLVLDLVNSLNLNTRIWTKK